MIVAVGWYASATLWAASGVIVSLLTGMGLVVVTYRTLPPKRRFLYAMEIAAPMRDQPGTSRDDLIVLHAGSQLDNPHILEVQLSGRGRRDIPSSAYDSGEPIILDVGATIVKLLQETSNPASLPLPKVEIVGKTLRIGPSLIGRRQAITFTLLADGAKPVLNCQSPLIDVTAECRTRPTPASDEIEWLFDQRQAIGCISVPIVYTAIGIAWAAAGLGAAFIAMLVSSLSLWVVVIMMLVGRRFRARYREQRALRPSTSVHKY